MEDREWRMENGEWRMEIGDWGLGGWHVLVVAGERGILTAWCLQEMVWPSVLRVVISRVRLLAFGCFSLMAYQPMRKVSMEVS